MARDEVRPWRWLRSSVVRWLWWGGRRSRCRGPWRRARATIAVPARRGGRGWAPPATISSVASSSAAPARGWAGPAPPPSSPSPAAPAAPSSAAASPAPSARVLHPRKPKPIRLPTREAETTTRVPPPPRGSCGTGGGRVDKLSSWRTASRGEEASSSKQDD